MVTNLRDEFWCPPVSLWTEMRKKAPKSCLRWQRRAVFFMCISSLTYCHSCAMNCSPSLGPCVASTTFCSMWKLSSLVRVDGWLPKLCAVVKPRSMANVSCCWQTCHATSQQPSTSNVTCLVVATLQHLATEQWFGVVDHISIWKVDSCCVAYRNWHILLRRYGSALEDG